MVAVAVGRQGEEKGSRFFSSFLFFSSGGRPWSLLFGVERHKKGSFCGGGFFCFAEQGEGLNYWVLVRSGKFVGEWFFFLGLEHCVFSYLCVQCWLVQWSAVGSYLVAKAPMKRPILILSHTRSPPSLGDSSQLIPQAGRPTTTPS